MVDSLVPWKKKWDNYNDEADEDETEARSPRLTDTLQDVKFIKRDETNATAMKHLKIKWWDKK